MKGCTHRRSTKAPTMTTVTASWSESWHTMWAGALCCRCCSNSRLGLPRLQRDELSTKRSDLVVLLGNAGSHYSHLPLQLPHLSPCTGLCLPSIGL